MDAAMVAIAALCALYLLGEGFPYVRKAWRAINTSNLQRWRETQKRARNASRMFYPTKTPGVRADNDIPLCVCGEHSALYCNITACDRERP